MLKDHPGEISPCLGRQVLERKKILLKVAKGRIKIKSVQCTIDSHLILLEAILGLEDF